MREVGVRTTRYSPPPSEYSPTFRDLTWFGLIGMFYRLQARIIRQTILQSRMLFNALLATVCRIFVSFGWRSRVTMYEGVRKIRDLKCFLAQLYGTVRWCLVF